MPEIQTSPATSPKDDPQPWCCWIDTTGGLKTKCERDAEFEVAASKDFCDYTHCCTTHLPLMSDKNDRVWSLADNTEVFLDDPRRATAG